MVRVSVNKMMEVRVHQGDLSDCDLDAALAQNLVAWDIETSGLDWQRDRIGTCQVAYGDTVEVVVLDAWSSPSNLRALLEEATVRKVFHHAPFDLRFMTAHWKCEARNVACTKIASKILNPELDRADHSLMPVLRRRLGVVISKDQQVSDWTSGVLTEAQVNYAAGDVTHLLDLYDDLSRECERLGLLDVLEASYDYLPARVALDLRGAGDVFAY